MVSTFVTLASSMKTVTPESAATSRLWPFLLGLAALLVAVVVFWTTWHDASQPVVRHRPHAELADIGNRLVRLSPSHSENMPTQGRPHQPPWMIEITRYLSSAPYRDLMHIQLGLLLTFLTLLFFTALKVTGPPGALLATALAALTPAFLGLSLEFDDHLLNLCVVMFTALLIVNSRGLSRLVFPLVAGVVLAAGVALVWTKSNGLLMLAAIGPFAALHFFLPPIAQEDHARTAGLRRPFIGLVLLFLPSALLLVAASNLGGAAYVSEQLGQRHYPMVNALPSLLAYFPVLFFFQLGPVISLAMVASLTGLWKNSRRLLPWLAWFWTTVILLSLLPKKNEWYLLYALPAVPVTIAIAWNTIRPRLIRWGLAAAALGGGLLVIAWAINGPTSAPPVGNHTELNPYRAFDRPVVRYLHAPVQPPSECYELANVVGRAAPYFSSDTNLNVWIVSNDPGLICDVAFRAFTLSAMRRTLPPAHWAVQARNELPDLAAVALNSCSPETLAASPTPLPWCDALAALADGDSPAPVTIADPSEPDATARLTYFSQTPRHAVFVVKQN